MLTFVNITDSVRVERALTEKNEALRKADELKNDFVQHVSYELRSPLTNIIGFADLLKTPAFGSLTERQAEYVDHISTSSSLLLTIVNDILDLATVDAGIIELELFRNQPRRTSSTKCRCRWPTGCRKAPSRCEIDAPDMLGPFVADHQRLKQILIKLLTNAANFAPDGSTISLKCRARRHDFVFSVTDNGAGIPQDILDTVFNRFESQGRQARGAGLGLSIVESFVSLHHGTVSIDSRDGRRNGSHLPHSIRRPAATRRRGMTQRTSSISLFLADEAATIELGEDLALALKAGDCLALSGDLGAGKSTLARAFLRAMADDDELEVPSPTFTLVQSYELRIPVSHFDLYRLARCRRTGRARLRRGAVRRHLPGGMAGEWPRANCRRTRIDLHT